MDRFQKIELTVIFVILVFNILFVISLARSGVISGFLIFGDKKVDSPSDFVNERDIEAYSDKVVINIENPILTRYDDSGSMLPLINENATGIGVKPRSENDIHIGDIITFERNGISIVHRIIEKNRDGQGIYFITKGDNNDADDGKIRFEEIDYVLVGIIY